MPVPMPDGTRHSEARFVVSAGKGRVMIGGMVDGPGTHSADVDATLLRANGFVRVVKVP